MSESKIPHSTFENIPDVLKDHLGFCLWRYETRKGQKTKVPYNPVTGLKAATDTPSTFASFSTALETLKNGSKGVYNGLGVRVSNGIAAVDIDHCIVPASSGGEVSGGGGILNDVARQVISLLPNAYFERSPSGKGLRGFFLVDPDFVFDKSLYYINNRKLGLEVYFPGATNRFVTVTGDVFRAGSVSRSDEAVQTLLDALMKRSTPVRRIGIPAQSYLTDEQVIEKAEHSASGEKFTDFMSGDWDKYFDNQSDADMSFVSMLAFWCGNDENQMDRIYRSSGMMREKWDRVQAGSTYGALTMKNVVSTNQNIYLPINRRDLMGFKDLDAAGSVSSGSAGSASNGSSATASSTAGHDDNGVDPRAEGRLAECFTPDLSRITLSMKEMRPDTNPRYGRNEIGLGNIFADYYKPIARYNRDRGIWFVFDGRIWRADEGDLMVSELAKHLADQLYSYALCIGNEDMRRQYIERVKKLQQRRNRDTMVKDARSVHPISMDVFDHHAELFNCQNGTLNLNTLDFLPHDPNDYLTKLSGVTYDPKADCPRWHSFISEVMCGDKNTAEYLQKALGYALYGASSLECLFILYGATSRNGKGTTMETFLSIMGDYGKTSNPEMLGSKFNANSSGPSEEIARLAGVRFVNISEPEKRMAFNAALVKRMTGNDTLNARFLHENSFDFKPVFKIFINTNYLPNVSDTTLFDSGRLRIIPFNRHFDDKEQDKGLKGFFHKPENLSGIFNWCVEGYRKFVTEGLAPTKAVEEATCSYYEDSDRIGQFIDAYLEEGESYEASSKAVFLLYRNWCEENNYTPENIKNFNDAMKKRYGYARKRPRTGGEKTTLILGVRIREQERGNEDPDLAPFEKYPGEDAVEKD